MAEKEELARRLSAAVSRAISDALSQVEVRRHTVKTDHLGFLYRSFKLSCPFHTDRGCIDTDARKHVLSYLLLFNRRVLLLKLHQFRYVTKIFMFLYIANSTSLPCQGDPMR